MNVEHELSSPVHVHTCRVLGRVISLCLHRHTTNCCWVADLAILTELFQKSLLECLILVWNAILGSGWVRVRYRGSEGDEGQDSGIKFCEKHLSDKPNYLLLNFLNLHNTTFLHSIGLPPAVSSSHYLLRGAIPYRWKAWQRHLCGRLDADLRHPETTDTEDNTWSTISASKEIVLLEKKDLYSTSVIWFVHVHKSQIK